MSGFLNSLPGCPAFCVSIPPLCFWQIVFLKKRADHIGLPEHLQSAHTQAITQTPCVSVVRSKCLFWSSLQLPWNSCPFQIHCCGSERPCDLLLPSDANLCNHQSPTIFQGHTQMSFRSFHMPSVVIIYFLLPCCSAMFELQCLYYST